MRMVLAATALLCGIGASAIGAIPARAEYPDHSITIEVPFAAGGPTDTVARLLAESMGRALKQTVVAENITGAAGTIAAQKVASAKPDGYTLLIHHIGHATSATLYRHLTYSPENSLAPIGLISDTPMMVVVRPDLPVKTLPEFIALLKKEGDEISIGNSGVGGPTWLCGMLLQQAAGKQATTVPYRGSAPALTELMGGRIDAFCDQGTSSLPFAKDGKIKALAVTSAQRLPALPDVPTTAEAGQPDLTIGVWHGLFAPKGTPPEVIAKLSAALQTALKDPVLLSRMADLVTYPVSPDKATPEYLKTFLASEVVRWGAIVKAGNAYAD